MSKKLKKGKNSAKMLQSVCKILCALSADYGSSDYPIYNIRYTKEELKNRKYKLN